MRQRLSGRGILATRLLALAAVERQQLYDALSCINELRADHNVAPRNVVADADRQASHAAVATVRLSDMGAA